MTKNCKNLENKISLYLDNVLSTADKQAVEEHLKSCPHCTKALADMHKVKAVTGKLSEVEPPTWFKQKIMAKVRAEAQKKSFAEKWFYPLRIKVPVQVFAAIFIVVIAVYIYRAGDEQFKEVMPPVATTPMMEEQKDKMPGQSTKAPEVVTSTMTKEKVVAQKDTRDEKVDMYDVSSGVAAEKSQESKKGIPQENIRAGAADKGKAKPAESEQVAAHPSVVGESKKEGYTLGAAMKESRAPEVQKLMPKANILVRVAGINIAVAEVEKLLAKNGAKKVAKQMTEGKAIFTADLKVENMKELIAQLKTIGKVEEKVLPAISTESYISVVIEIQDQ